MAKAREALEDLSLDPEVERRLEEWFAEGEFWHEYYLHRAVEKAEARGLEQGLERGLEKGLEQGLEKGLERARRALVTSIERRLVRRLGDRLTKRHRSRVAGSSLDELTRLDELVDEDTDEQLLERLG